MVKEYVFLVIARGKNAKHKELKRRNIISQKQKGKLQQHIYKFMETDGLLAVSLSF